MSGELKNQRVVILAADGFAQSELEPLEILRRNSTAVDIISLHSCETKGVQHKEKSDKVHIGIAFGRAKARQRHRPCSAGRSPRPDVLRTDPRAVRFVHQFVDANKPIAATRRAPWTLIGTGRRMTSWASFKTELTNAGAEWVDEEVVVDEGLVTNRKHDDLPAFCAKVPEAGDSRLGEIGRRTQ
jgi:deglycase